MAGAARGAESAWRARAACVVGSGPSSHEEREKSETRVREGEKNRTRSAGDFNATFQLQPFFVLLIHPT